MFPFLLSLGGPYKIAKKLYTADEAINKVREDMNARKRARDQVV